MRIPSVETISQITAAVAAGGTLRKVARQFDVSTGTVQAIKRGVYRLPSVKYIRSIEVVNQILAAVAAGGTLHAVAAQFGTSDTAVGLIRQGRHPLQLQRPDGRRVRRKVDLSAVVVEGASGQGFLPTRRQIREARRAIRSSWSREERQKRWEWAHSVTLADLELQKRVVG